MSRFRQLFGGAAILFAVAGCRLSSVLDPASGESIRTVAGTVVWLDLEGGFYAIRGADRVTYDPLDLPAAFQQDQLAVRATLRIRDDMGSYHMVGPMVDVLGIQRR